MVDWRTDPERWVERRTQYLTTTAPSLRPAVAEAVGWSELGYSASGIAKRMDVAESTAGNYLDTASQARPGVLLTTAADMDGDPEADYDGPVSKTECPVCLNESLIGGDNLNAVFSTSSWGSKAMLDDADLVCWVCHSVRIDGGWSRIETADSRAYSLAQASSTKDASEYREMLTRGIDPGSGEAGGGQSDRAAPDADELDW